MDFTNGENSLRIHCFDEDSEMKLVIKRSPRSLPAAYQLTLSEAKELRDFLSKHIRNQS